MIIPPTKASVLPGDTLQNQLPACKCKLCVECYLITHPDTQAHTDTSTLKVSLHKTPAGKWRHRNRNMKKHVYSILAKKKERKKPEPPPTPPTNHHTQTLHPSTKTRQMKALKCKTLGGIHALSHIEQQVPRTFHAIHNTQYR